MHAMPSVNHFRPRTPISVLFEAQHAARFYLVATRMLVNSCRRSFALGICVIDTGISQSTGEGEGNVTKTLIFKNETPRKSLSNVQSYSKGGQRLEIARDLAKRQSSVKFEQFFERHPDCHWLKNNASDLSMQYLASDYIH